MQGMRTQSSRLRGRGVDPRGTLLPAPPSIIEHIDPERLDSIETIRVSREAPWDESGEELLRLWMDAARKHAEEHRLRGYRLKKFYRFTGILSILSAAILFFAAGILFSPDEYINDIFHRAFTLINLVIINLTTFMGFGPRYQEHFEYEGRYNKLVCDLQEILATHGEFRSPKDKTLAEYKEVMGNLLSIAPEV